MFEGLEEATKRKLLEIYKLDFMLFDYKWEKYF